MKRKAVRIISIALTLVLLFSAFPSAEIMAEENAEIGLAEEKTTTSSAAAIDEDDQDVDESDIEEDENDISDFDYIEMNDLANSFRYKDGQPIQSNARYAEYAIWPTDVPDAVGYGIDVSKYQKKIDWEEAKNAGVDFAIIRCGYGSDYTYQDDEYWEINAKACEQSDIPYGTYLYSYALSVEDAESEAQHVLRLVEGYDLSYPVYYDLEDEIIRSNLSETQIADIAETFCGIIEDAGYDVAVYANKDWFTNYLTDSRFEQWDKWVAQYNTECNYEGEYSMWQCSSKGQVSGITGYVDLNIELETAAWSEWVDYDPDRYGDVKNSTALVSEPDTGEELITIPEGERVLLEGYGKISDTCWYKTSYEGNTGYVLSTDVKLSYQAYDPEKTGITTANMYMRSGVGLDYAKKTYIKSGSYITLQGYYRTEGYDWYKIIYDGITGYVSSKYVIRTEDIPESTVVYDPLRYVDVERDTVYKNGSGASASEVGTVPAGARIYSYGYDRYDEDTAWSKTEKLLAACVCTSSRCSAGPDW